MSNIREVSPTASFALMQKGALLVDVREPSEIAKKSFDVPDIMMIPLRQLEQRYQEIPVNRKVVLACRSGGRSGIATRFLTDHGYSKAVNMQHGIVGWERDGLPLKREAGQKTGSWLKQMFNSKA
ncbi:MAG: rhodanese-like domain-containing protein [Chlorobium sp.]|nr:MAG: rhodanese-like domain-containing protein [Chlorobium sp.]